MYGRGGVEPRRGRASYVTMEYLKYGVARAIVANAGNAARLRAENARRMAKVAAKVLGVDEDD